MLLLATAGVLPAVAGAAGSPQTTFVGVHVVDVRRGVVVRDQTVIVSDGRIVRVGPAGELQIQAAAQVVEARGRYLAPGLMDMHAHVSSAEDLALYLANGATTIRSMWGHPSTLELRAAVAAGRVPGPTLFVAG